jgi:hypothetical protein
MSVRRGGVDRRSKIDLVKSLRASLLIRSFASIKGSYVLKWYETPLNLSTLGRYSFAVSYGFDSLTDSELLI